MYKLEYSFLSTHMCCVLPRLATREMMQEKNGDVGGCVSNHHQIHLLVYLIIIIISSFFDYLVIVNNTIK